MKFLIPPPIQVVICALMIWFSAGFVSLLDFSIPWQTQIAILLAVLGVVIDFLSIRLFVKARTTVNPLDPSKTDSLVTAGIYNHTRNPMYVGMVLFLSAFGVWMGNLVFIPLVALFVWYITTFQIKPEEEILLEKFGDKYASYCSKVRRWI